MRAAGPEVWIATADGRDVVRADAIVVVRLDGGRVTAQLRDEARQAVTLIDGTTGVRPPPDFHRRLVRLVAELADASGAQLVRTVCDEGGWRWVAEPL
ncbi:MULTISPECIES: hypothetical protein [Thermomonospora]|uniref:Uncharacterized protein n=1 Tax=Thermomonospora curvata (strain ATCC 19995 / DSM 43183 / JCM 3096 / KCTC 9072 / NBRC 15933 / NCIMB 10081 / Henssen B9) TaxID=471852 RepID=D1A1D6_THECD|nr:MULTISPECIES: hypothetical protein [Thermomonospora]ACY95858.1 hypothetical protein Tcur_0253 [Thermomonospora curvata DSM 43183]PKK16104.1 MAG: hypothetical protein BUE48_001255 [Thermomonospora sp. CIF 1]